MSGTIINDKLEGNAEGNLYDYSATTSLRCVTEGECVLYTVESSACKLGNISPLDWAYNVFSGRT